MTTRREQLVHIAALDPGDVLPAPPDLGRAEREAWSAVVAKCPDNVLRASDAQFLAAVARHYQLWRQGYCDLETRRVLLRMFGLLLIPWPSRRALLDPDRPKRSARQ